MENNVEVMEVEVSEGEDSNKSGANLNESVSSNTDLNSSQNSGKNSTKKRKLSKKEREILKLERERQKIEKEKQIREEKERKAKELQLKKELIEKERIEKQRIKDEEKEKRDREKREKEAQKQRLKEEKEKERLEKLQLKENEKIKKQEERDAQMEKKRKLEEEKQRKQNEKLKVSEEEKRKLEKSKQLLNRFIKKGADDTTRPVKNVLTDMKCSTNGLFLPFQLSANQTLAPIVNESVKERFVLGAFDAVIESQDSVQLYIELLKNDLHKPFKYTKPRSQPEIIIDDTFEDNENERKFYKIKHLQFHQNVRPPYRGTWRKKSRLLSGRKPFHKDSDFFDYEVDSDEEWDEGGPGESLDGSDSDDSNKDDYEIDNEFFVPHGYLSPDENDENDELNNSNVNTDNDIQMADDQLEGKEPKSGPLLKEQVLMAERNRSFAKTLIPVVIGCVWESNAEQNNQKFVDALQQFKRIAIINK